MIRARTTKIDEYQFLTCVEHGLWGSKAARFRDWEVGDTLFFIVDNALAGFAVISGAPYKASNPVWDNGVFPHRIPITFAHVLLPEKRPQILGDVRAIVTTAYKSEWGLGLVNQWLMKPEAAHAIEAVITAVPNDLDRIISTLPKLLSEAKAQRQFKPRKKAPAKSDTAPAEAASKESTPSLHVVKGAPPFPHDSLHLDAQAALIELGRSVGCDVWVASNDRSKVVRGAQLGTDCIKSLPNMGLTGEAAKAIGLIDVIWLKRNAPQAAFEVETTTSVHSGLLRMSDLVELVPALKMDLYIVAPQDREDKVLREMARPTFRRIGLPDICRFVALEELTDLSKRVKGFGGHIQPSIIETIAVALSDQQEIGLA